MTNHLQTLIVRELDALAREVKLYSDDHTPWKALPGCPNTGGNLVLHLVGNLRHFIGAQFGRTGYVRNREAEFASRGISRADLLALIDLAKAEVTSTLSTLDPAALNEPHQAPGDRNIEAGLWLMHLAVHLGYHLGQVDYHRRAVTGNIASAETLPLQPLVMGPG